MSWAIILPIMLALFALNMRLYLGILAAVVLYFLFFATMPLEIAVQRFIAPSQNASLLAIPFFVLLGTLLSRSGIAERVVDLALILVGRMRGGLAVGNILVSTLLGGLSASNLADSAMLTRMMVPEMEKRGYGRAFSAAVTATGALVTPIIPPGIALIIYALIADVSVAAMFMAGIVPGLLCALFLMGVSYLISVKRGYRPARSQAASGRETIGTVVGAWPALLLIAIIIGGIRFGVFTATEAGAIAVLLVIVAGVLIYRQMGARDILEAVFEASKSTASVMLIIMASGALGWVFSVEKAGVALADFITAQTSNPYMFFLMVNVILLLLGMLIEGTALLIILVPLLKPTLATLGIDPVHFGIVMILNLSIGTLTPPVGTVMLLVTNLSKTGIAEFTREALPFFGVLLLVLALVVLFPVLAIGL